MPRLGGGPPIYVSVDIAAPLDEVWRLTQDTRLHPRWDARFSSIEPVAELPGGGQRFRYELRLPGHLLAGTGTTVGERWRPDGTRTSALRFTTPDRLSPLGDGRGYWRYEPLADGVRFTTGYDYRPGWGGLLGGLADRLVLRRFIGWLTAWSFDRLRIWAERGEEPERWPWHSVLWVWRPERPRAARCRRRAPGGRVMSARPRHPRRPGGTVTGIFEQAMGADFACLHPELQRRFGVGLDAGYACVGRGTMHRIRRGPWWTVPFLQLGRMRNILVPDTGTDVPFTIENYPYRDPFGREAVTFVREYRLRGRTRRFDATMIRAHDGHVVDYLGTHQHLAVDLELHAEPDGSLLLRSHAQRFYEGPLGFRFPLVFSGRAELRERYDEDAGVFRVDLEVTNPVFGFLFGYDGEFTCDFVPAHDAPARLRPERHERRQ